MALQGLSSTEINRKLKDPQFAKALLKVTDPKAYRQLERSGDQMTVLQRLGEGLSFGETADDFVWAMSKMHDPETGRLTPLRFAGANLALPAKWVESGARKLGGALINSKKISNYDGPRGKDLVPQAMANAMNMKGGDNALAAKAQAGKQALDWRDKEAMLDSIPFFNEGKNEGKGRKTAFNIGSGAIGLAADIAGDPTFWVSGGLTAGAKKGAQGMRVIKKGLKSEGAETLTKLASKNMEGATKAAQIATDALTKAGLEVTEESLGKVIRKSTVLRDLASEGTQKGLYLSGPLTKNAKLLKGGQKAETVARYLENPLFAAIGDGWNKVLRKVPVGVNQDETIETIGDTFDDMVDGLRKLFDPNYFFKDNPKLQKHVKDMQKGFIATDALSTAEEVQIQETLEALAKDGKLPEEFLEPENYHKFIEMLTGNTQRTQLGTFIDNMPSWKMGSKQMGISEKTKGFVATKLDEVAKKAADADVFDVAEEMDKAVRKSYQALDAGEQVPLYRGLKSKRLKGKEYGLDFYTLDKRIAQEYAEGRDIMDYANETTRTEAGGKGVLQKVMAQPKKLLNVRKLSKGDKIPWTKKQIKELSELEYQVPHQDTPMKDPFNMKRFLTEGSHAKDHWELNFDHPAFKKGTFDDKFWEKVKGLGYDSLMISDRTKGTPHDSIAILDDTILNKVERVDKAVQEGKMAKVEELKNTKQVLMEMFDKYSPNGAFKNQIKDLVDAGYDPAVADFMVRNPAQAQQILSDEAAIQAIRDGYIKSNRNKIREKKALEWLDNNKTLKQYTKRKFKAPVNVPLEQKKALLSSYDESLMKKIRSKAAKDVDPEAIEQLTDDKLIGMLSGSAQDRFHLLQAEEAFDGREGLRKFLRTYKKDDFDKMLKAAKAQATDEYMTNLVYDKLASPVKREWLTTYRPKDRESLLKEAYKHVSNAEVEEEVNKLLQDVIPGAKMSDFEGRGAMDPVYQELDNWFRDFGEDINIKSIDDITPERMERLTDSNYFAQVMKDLQEEEGFGMVARKSSDFAWDYNQVHNRLLDILNSPLDPAEIEKYQDMLILNDLVKENGYQTVLKMMLEEGDQSVDSLMKAVTKPYGVFWDTNKKGQKHLSVNEYMAGESKFEKYLETAAMRKGHKDATKLVQQQRDGLAATIQKAMKESNVGDNATRAYNAQETIDKAVRTSSKSAPVMSEAEELIANSISRQTPVAEIDPAQLEDLLKGIGLYEEGRKRIIQGVMAYQEDVVAGEKLVGDFVNWLSGTNMPGHKKEEIMGMIQRIQGNYGADMSQDVVRKRVAKDLGEFERLIMDMAKTDKTSAQMAQYLQTSLINPMRRSVKDYTLREKMGWGNIGVYGVGSKTMDIENPDVARYFSLMTSKQRKIANDATMKAYNEILGEEAFKTVDRVKSFARDHGGKQVVESGRAAVMEKFSADLLDDIKHNRLGEDVKIFKKGADIDHKTWEKIKGPLLEDANVYAKKGVARHINSITNRYFRQEAPKAISVIRDFNNVWKGVQTGGGANLPQIGEKGMKILKKMGLENYGNFYNQHLSFLPFSQAFTARNLYGNFQNIMLDTDMTVKEWIDLTREAPAIDRYVSQRMGDKFFNQGMFGAIKGTWGEDEVARYGEEVIESGLLGSIYKKSLQNQTDDLAGPLGGMAQKLGDHFVNSRSMDFNGHMELMDKIKVFVHERQLGATIEDAAATAERALFDYSDLTSFEREWVKPLTVFYTWTKKNLELMGRTAVNKPQKFKTYSKLLLEPREQFGNEEERQEERLPGWTRDVVGIPVKSGDDMAFLSGWGGNLEAASEWIGTGGTDMAEGGKQTIRQAVDMLAPTFKVPLNLALGMNTFKGDKIEDDTSAYRYRALPQPIKNLMGVKEKTWQDREGNTGTTYTMDGEKKYIVESMFGRLSTNPSRLATILRGDENRLEGLADLATGFKTSRYDQDYLEYKSERDEYENLMQKLERLGLVSDYTGYGYNSRSAQLNYPDIEEFFRNSN